MTFDELINKVSEHILDPVVGFLFALALLVFVWGMFKFVANADNEEGRKTGRLAIIFGIIGMFIMFSAFGIMNLIGKTVETLGQ